MFVSMPLSLFLFAGRPPLFATQMAGNAIPPEFFPAIEKGFREAANSGPLIGAPVEVGGWWCRS